ncbi:M48 family metalloprotease [Massilia sp. CF038]|uniref:M48 family metalloprotease n=1 Tax=Massilia sp. CF038 TaxID=1881045 RepID=UPI00091CEFC3|nr:M48 family metalloprotease [Massilia sp. CF038]SHG62338.1 Peptidase family M48 [Massilia sp. CF038]
MESHSLPPAARDASALHPLPYHATIADYLQRHEPDVWRWAAARATVDEQRESLRTMLLRDTYRIDAQAHAEVHMALATAMQRLQIEAPATLYQSAGQEMNASLVYVPGEIHIVLHGPLLERMSAPELLAVFGHELSHYLLWSCDESRHLVTDRILGDTVRTPTSTRSQEETYRRYSLHTELFADRGSAVAAGSVGAAVAALVKVQTGIAAVDPDAYLRQAAEVDAKEAGASAQFSHPETFIRARALALWWDQSDQLDAWLEQRLHGMLSLERLDLQGQLRLQAMTRGFVAHFLDANAFASDAVMAQVRMLFPDWREDEAALAPQAFDAAQVDDSVRHYLNALMLDLALADPDQQDAALLRAGRIAQAMGSYDALLKNLQRDAGFGRRELDRYKRQLAKEVQP